MNSENVQQVKPSFINELLPGTMTITIYESDIRDIQHIDDEFMVYVACKIPSNQDGVKAH